MMLIDSNIFIYAASPENEYLREFIEKNSPSASEISRLEVLGYHHLIPQHKAFFESLFAVTTLITISSEVLETAIAIRQKRKVALGDALIAGTAIVHELPLATRNTKDFKWITELELIDPFEK